MIGVLYVESAANAYCDRVDLKAWCLNDTLLANCTSDCAHNVSLTCYTDNTVNIPLTCYPDTVNSSVNAPLNRIEEYRAFDAENASLVCNATSSDDGVLSANISLSGVCDEWTGESGKQHPGHQRSSEQHGSAWYSVDIPSRPDSELTTNLRVSARGSVVPTLKELPDGFRIKGFGSDILEVEVRDEAGILVTDFSDNPVLLNFTIDSYDPEEVKPVCCFEQESNYWSTQGCRISSQKANSVQCSCNHLTSFAILMQTTEVQLSEADARMLDILTKIGLSLSITCLVLTLLVYALCRLKSLRIVIHANLAFALLLAHTVFLFINTPNQAGCATVAVFLHFFLLAAFSWMALEGVFLLIKSTPTFQLRIRMPVWLAVGWGLPAVVVLISVAARFSGYLNSQYCWLSFENGFVWSFITPVIIIMIFNAVILIRLIFIFMSLQTNKKKSEAQKMKAGLRLVLILAPLLGLPWIIGLLYSNQHTTFFAYVFVICNSLQGVFLFVSQCLLDEEVRHKLKLLKSKRSSKVISLTSSSNAQEKSSKETIVLSRSCRQGGVLTVSRGGVSRRAESAKLRLGTDMQEVHINEKQETQKQSAPCVPSYDVGYKHEDFEKNKPDLIKQLFKVQDKRDHGEQFEFVTSEYSVLKNEIGDKDGTDLTSQLPRTPDAEAASVQDDYPEIRPSTQETDITDSEDPWEPGVVKECFAEHKGERRYNTRVRGEWKKQVKLTKMWRY
ncbi:adhesion G protein-coupled receptor E5-like [Patiria miniata]|uniref:Uncharacterized protein n=1 Tax=Patiria miniata TaxID=46514 RepID=A0A914ALG2_PATMI|nr:adhesion G protein-coupled receptor E5-like [Patiria miniata]